ncbi:MAG: FkbM family methyltransferase [Woeseia sp.]
MRLRKSVTVSTRQGVFEILMATHEFVGKSLYCYGEFELEVMASAMEFLRNNQKCPPKGHGTVVDIGAHNGVTSIGMLCTGELQKAIAIEPEPRNFAMLQRNVTLNGLEDRIVALPYAVSDRKDEIEFELSKNNFGDHRVRMNANAVAADSAELYDESRRRVITVKADRLDNLLAGLPDSFTDNIALVWIDVQGYEGYAFMGAKTLLSKGIPVVSEIWPYGLRRAGMSPEKYYAIASSIWDDYWVWRNGDYVRYPIDTLNSLMDELGYDGNHTNIIFTQ